MNTMLEEDKTKEISHMPKMGSIVEGKVVARDRSALFIDLGIQGTGIIYGREFYQAKDAIKNLKIGDAIRAKITELENDEGYRELSLQDAAKEMGWQQLREMKDREEIIKVKIIGVNKGGLLTNINNIPAFLPVSQLSPENYPRVEDADKQKILKELQKFIGKTLEVKILDLLAQENKLILSEKAKTEQAIKDLLKNFKKGDVVEGTITGIADFGAFIKFSVKNSKESENEKTEEQNPPLDKASSFVKTSEDKSEEQGNEGMEESNETAGPAPKAQIEGLIHISELDWQLVQNPAEIVKIGEAVKAQIIDINKSQVFLSLKSLKENPWEKIEKEHKKGDTIKGKVISLNPFGAFVEVAPKIRGLCHISEFSSQKEMEESLKIGETYDFEILQIEPKEYRMSLKLVEKK